MTMITHMPTRSSHFLSQLAFFLKNPVKLFADGENELRASSFIYIGIRGGKVGVTRIRKKRHKAENNRVIPLFSSEHIFNLIPGLFKAIHIVFVFGKLYLSILVNH